MDVFSHPFTQSLITAHAGMRRNLWHPFGIQISLKKFQKNYQKYLVKCEILSPKIVLFWKYLIRRRTLQISERCDASARTPETSFLSPIFRHPKNFRKKYISCFEMCIRRWRMIWTFTHILISCQKDTFLLPTQTLVRRTCFAPRVLHNLDSS